MMETQERRSGKTGSGLLEAEAKRRQRRTFKTMNGGQRAIVIAVVAALVLVVFIVIIVLNGDGSKSKLVQMYQETGYAAHTITSSDGTSSACSQDMATIPLVIGGTIDLNGTHIAAEQNDMGVTVVFDGKSTVVAAIVDSSKPVVVPKGLGSGTRLEFAEKNFPGLKSVVLCAPSN